MTREEALAALPSMSPRKLRLMVCAWLRPRVLPEFLPIIELAEQHADGKTTTRDVQAILERSPASAPLFTVDPLKLCRFVCFGVRE